jgi:hypothetical protein
MGESGRAQSLFFDCAPYLQHIERDRKRIVEKRDEGEEEEDGPLVFLRPVSN